MPEEVVGEEAEVPAGRDATAPDGTIDESKLTPDQRQKLHVLRRITGGRIPDVELLARLESETAGSAPAGADKRKKGRWWSG